MDPIAERLLHAIAAPPERGGLAVAVSMAIELLRAAQTVYPSPRLATISSAAEALLRQLNGEVGTEPSLRIVSDRERRAPVYGFFVEPPRLVGPVDQLMQLRALAGSAIAFAVAKNEEIAKSYAEGLSKVWRAYMKARMPQDWHTVAAALPLREQEIDGALERCSSEPVRRFLLATREVHKASLIPFQHLVPNQSVVQSGAGTKSTDVPSPYGQPSIGEAGQSGRDAGGGAPAGYADLLQWQLRRAEFARFPDTVGLPASYGRLPKLALRQVGFGIARALGEEGRRADHALFAALSLAFALPPKHACRIPLGSSDSISLDPRGYVRWDLGKIIGGGENPVLVPLPEIAVERLRQATLLRRLAADIGQVCGIPEAGAERARWFEEYKSFLKSTGDSSYAASRSRFAYSFGQVCLDECRQDILAASCSLTFALIPIAALHYTWMSAASIQDTVAKAYAAIGLGDVISLPEDYAGAGPRDVPTRASFEAGWKRLVDDSGGQLRALEAASTPEALAAEWTSLCESNALMFALQTGHRGQRMERCTLGAVFASEDHVFLSDKDTADGGSARLLPKTEPLTCLLHWHRHCLAVLSRQATSLIGGGERLSEWARAGLPYSKAAFFALEWRASEVRLVRKSMTTARLTRLAKSIFDAKANVGRKFWVTELVRRGADRWLTRLLTFHRRQGAEPDHHVQVQVLDEALGALRKVMDAAMHELAVPMPVVPCAGARMDLAAYPLPRPSKGSPEEEAQKWAQAAKLQSSSLSAIRLVDSVRLKLSRKSTPPAARAVLALHAVVFDGITSEHVLKALVLRTREATVMQGRVPAIRCELGHRLVIQPLQGATWAQLPCVLAMSEQGVWTEVIAGAAKWLRAQLPEFAWDRDNAPWAQLLASMQHWLHLKLPSLLNTAAQRAGEIAVLSEASCARLAGGEAHVEEMSSPTRPILPARTRHWSIADLSRPVHRWGDSCERLDGNVTRAGGLLKELQAIPMGAPGSPAAACRLWINTEARGSLSKVPGCLEISSMSTYLSYLTAPLTALSPLEDLRCWDNEQWSEFLEQVREPVALKVREDSSQRRKDREAAFYRFARALAEDRAYCVPLWVFNKQRRDRTRGGRHAASSVFIGERHRVRAKSLLSQWLREEPWKLRQCLLLLDLTFELPLRIAEPLALACSALMATSPHLVLTANGFSHLKTSTSKRLLPASPQLSADFREAAALAAQLRPGRANVFLAEGDSLDEAAELVALVNIALQEVVGDATLVMHSLRGGAIARTLLAPWEELMTGALRLESGPSAAARLFAYDPKKWLLAAEAAGRAGHSERDRLVQDYFAIWAQARYVALSSTLAEFRLEPGLIVQAGVGPAAVRQARSRHEDDRGAFDEWAWWQQRLPDPQLASLRAEAAVRTSPRARTGLTADRPPPTLASKIRYVVKRYLGVDQEVAASSEEMWTRERALLESAVVRLQHAPGLSERSRAPPSPGSRRADLASLCGPDATSWLDACHPLKEGCVASLEGLLLRMSSVDWRDPDEVENVVGHAVQVLPAGTALEIVFGQKHHYAEVVGRLKAVGVRVGVPHRDYGGQPRVFVVRSTGARNDVEKARLTVLMRLLTHAFVVLRSLENAAGNGGCTGQVWTGSPELARAG